MTVIGEAFVKILGQADQAQISRDIGQSVTTAGRAQQSKVKKLFTGVAQSAAGALAGGLVFRRIAQFAGESVEAATEAEQAQLRLEAAYERFPALAGGNIEAMKELNTQTSRRIRFDDDALASAEAQLAQFKLNEDEIRTLIPLLADFAARTGRDVVSAASVAGKAILGQGRALKDVGIDFVDAGSSAANFDQLVTGLRRTVGGFAEKEAGSAGAQSAILANQFGELKEIVGNALLPALRAIVPPLRTVLEFFQDHPTVAKFVLGIGGAVTTLTALGLVVNTVRTGLSGLGISFGASAVESGALAGSQTAAAASAGAMAVAEGSAAVATEAEGIAASTAALQNQALNVSQIEVAASGAAGRGVMGALTTGVGGYVTVVGLAITAGVLWKKNLDDMNFAYEEQKKEIAASLPFLEAYTDNAIAGNHTREDLIRTIKNEIQHTKDEGGSVEEFLAIVKKGEDALKRYDSATAGVTSTTDKLPGSVHAAGRAVDGLALKLGNVIAELNQLNSIGVPAVLANELINAPGAPAIPAAPTFGATVPAATPAAVPINVNIDGKTVQRSGQRSRVLAGGG